MTDTAGSGRGVSDVTQLLSPSADSGQAEDANYVVPRTKSPSHTCGILILFLGIALGVATYVVTWYINKQATDAIADRYVPSVGSSDFESWIKNDGPNSPGVYMIYYLYNVSNAHDVLYNGASAEVNEVGPFVFQQHTHKVELNFSIPGEVRYKKWKWQTWHKEPVQFLEPDGTWTTYTSLNPHTTSVTMINPVPWGAAWQLIYDPYYSLRSKIGWFCDPRTPYHELNGTFFQCVQDLFFLGDQLKGTWKYILEDAGSQYGIFPTRTASEWLGVEPGSAINSTVLEAANKLAYLGNDQFHPDNRWAYFFNSTQADVQVSERDLEYEGVYFDRSNLSYAQTLYLWNGLETIKSLADFEKTRQPNILNYERKFIGWGEEIPIRGSRFLTTHYTHPHPSCGGENYSFWLAAGGRPVEFTCQGMVSVRGVDALQLRIADSNFARTTLNKDLYWSTIEGLGNETQFRNYGPVFATTPHFHGYPNLLKKFPVKGMKDRGSMDETFIHVEKESGLVIDAAERLQINVMTPFLDVPGALSHWWHGHPYYMGKECEACIPHLEYNITGGNIIPSLYFEKRSTLTASDAHMLKRLQTAFILTKWLPIGGGALAGLIVLFGGYRLYKTCHQDGVHAETERITQPNYGTHA